MTKMSPLGDVVLWAALPFSSRSDSWRDGGGPLAGTSHETLQRDSPLSSVLFFTRVAVWVPQRKTIRFMSVLQANVRYFNMSESRKEQSQHRMFSPRMVKCVQWLYSVSSFKCFILSYWITTLCWSKFHTRWVIFERVPGLLLTSYIFFDQRKIRFKMA